MSGNTKTTLAIVLGSVGLLLGGLGALTAFNAKKAVDSDAESTSEVHALVDERFQQAQERQDQIEATQKSDAEKFVEQLTQDERTLLRRINGNHRSIRQLNRRTRNLRQEVNTLKTRDNQLSNEIGQVENDQDSDFQELNQRINRLNNQIQQLQRQFSNLRGLVGN